MDGLYHTLNKKFFKETIFPDLETEPHAFDLKFDVESFSKDPNRAYNSALVRKLETVDFPDRESLLDYQASLQEDPLGWLAGLNGFLRALAGNEFFTLRDSVDHYLHIVNQLHQRIRNEPAELRGPCIHQGSGEKLIWKANPGVFFILLSALHNEGAFGTKRPGTEMMKVAEKLYAAFEVRSTRKGNKPYTLSTFKQNFKQTSAFQESQDFEGVNEAVEQLIDALKKLNMI